MTPLSPETFKEIASRCSSPLGNPFLDNLFDTYNGNPSVVDLPVYYRFLYFLSVARPGLSMVELGCKTGRASLHFLRGGGAYSTMIDVGDSLEREQLVMAGLTPGQRWSFHKCSSTSPQATNAVRAVQPPDIVFIDTDHTYSTTAEEFNIWSLVVRPGGVLLFDDIDGWPDGCGAFFRNLEAACALNSSYGRTLSLPELHPENWGFGVWFRPG